MPGIVCVRVDTVQALREVARFVCVRVQYEPPPIPTANFDWVAWEDGEEERGSAYGRTRDEAVENLLDEREVF